MLSMDVRVGSPVRQRASPDADTAALWLVPMCIAIIWLAAAMRWSMQDYVVPWDSKNQFYAFFRFLGASLAQGQSPFWNPYHYGGHPSIADPQSLIFSPVFVALAYLRPQASMATFDLAVFAHLLAGGLAIGEYGRLRGWAGPARVLAAMIFMLGGCASARLNHVGIIIAYGLFPVAHLAMERAFARSSLLSAMVFGAVAACVALGRTQVPLLLCLLLAILTLLAALRHGQLSATRRLMLISVAAVTAVAILVVPLLLTFQFAQYSNRPDVSLDEALRSSLHPLNWANFFAPDVFGSLRRGIDDWGPGYGRMPLVDSTDRAFNYLFCGSLPALLLLWHGLAGRRAALHDCRLFAAICATSMIYALGQYTPLFKILFEHVPGIALFRRPVDALFLFVIGLAYLAGELATAYVRNGCPTVSRKAGLTSLFVLIALIAGTLAFAAPVARLQDSAIQIAIAIALNGMLYLALRLPQSLPMRLAVLSLAITVTAAELVTRNAASRLNAEPHSAYALLEAPTPLARDIIATIRGDQKLLGQQFRRTRIEILGLGGPWQNAAMVYGLEVTNGYNPLRIGDFDRLVAPGESPYTARHREFTASFPGYGCLLGSLLGLQYVVLDRPLDQLPMRQMRTEAVPLMQGPQAWIYRLPGALPRATLEDSINVENTEDLVLAGLFPAQQRPSEVMVDVEEPLTQHYLPSAFPKSGTARIIEWRHDRVVVDVEASRPSILSLHDPWYPGWEVRVDGQLRPLLQTNVLFRGVEVPDGPHRVEFVYRPLSLANLMSAARGLWESED